MQVNSIQIYDNKSANFKGVLADSGSLRKFKARLKPSELARFDSYVKTIEESKDRSYYIFDYVKIGRPIFTKEIATISILNKNKTTQFPFLFTESPDNAMNLFKKLAERCSKI